jgi:hypothetical protein
MLGGGGLGHATVGRPFAHAAGSGYLFEKLEFEEAHREIIA